MQKQLIKNKDYLLKESKVFCMFPWIHLNVTPLGDVYPCCSTTYDSPVGNTNKDSLGSIINFQEMKNLRLNMLNEIKSNECKFCYLHEKDGGHSFRSYANDMFGKYIDEVLLDTNEDGSLNSFKIRYLDVRFTNICNFKCRTCGAEFSSQWALEDTTHSNASKKIFLHACSDNSLINEILSSLDNIDTIYFGGGEPLLMEEHYVLLDEILKKNLTDIKLRYNTNASNLQFKSRDVLALWDKFKYVEISASIDHYGERAEYIRHGTNWGTVESNLLAIRKKESIKFSMNTVLSVFNYLTLRDFYMYMIKLDLYKPDDYHNTLYKLLNPIYYSSKILPKHLKDIGRENNIQLIEYLEKNNFSSIETIKQAISFTDSDDLYDNAKDEFLDMTKKLDKIRNEDFIKTFPELTDVFNI